MGPVDPLDRGARMDRGRGRKERHTTMKRITLIGAVLALAACGPTMKELDLEAALVVLGDPGSEHREPPLDGEHEHLRGARNTSRRHGRVTKCGGMRAAGRGLERARAAALTCQLGNGAT